MATTSGPILATSRASFAVPIGDYDSIDSDGELSVKDDSLVASNHEQHENGQSTEVTVKASTGHPGSAGSQRSNKDTRPLDSAMGYETDLEVDDEADDYDVTGAHSYIESCKELGVVPASVFIRDMAKPELTMKHRGLGPKGAKAIAIPLVANTSVSELDLEDNWIETSGAIYIADMLKENCFITHLNLAQNKLGTESAKPISDMLITNATLTHINLMGNNFQPKDAQHFAHVMLENSRITNLNLSHNSFGEDTGDMFGHAVGENETLERLDLSWNNFRRESGNKLLDGIQVNSRLKYVNLAWNGLGLDCAQALANCVKYNSILTELDVSNNRITTDATMIIGRGLEANETLKVLRIGKNPIGTGGALVMLASINNERSIITMLDLTDVWVEKEFDDLYHDMKQSRQDLEVIHAGIIGLKVAYTSTKTPSSEKEEEETTGDETDLERFLKNDPMAIIKQHVDDKNLRMLDLFMAFDRNNDFKITPSEFQKGVKTAGIELTPKQVNTLIERLDGSVDEDGKIDYKELVEGSNQAQLRIREIKRIEEAKAAKS